MVDFSDGTWRSLVDGTEYDVNAIPDSEDLFARYDATEISASDGDSVATWSDETGGGNDLTAGGAPTFKENVQNGNPVVRFDGTNDYLDVSFAELAQPNTIFIVFKYTADSTVPIYTGDTDGGRHTFGADNTTENWTLSTENNTIEGSGKDQNWHISTGFFNDANSALRIDGTEDATGDLSGNGMIGLTVGSNLPNSANTPVDVGEILLYPQDKSGIFGDVESYLANKWGITI